MMFNVEIVVVLAVLLFLLGLALFISNSRLTIGVIGSLLASCLLGSWVAIATTYNRPIVDVIYYPIVQQQLPDGTVVDMIAFKDESGKTHVVNINSTLGLTTPADGEMYQVAKVKYSDHFWGLRFRDENKYRVIRKMSILP